MEWILYDFTVILNNVKDPALGLSERPCEILRFTQDDTLSGFNRSYFSNSSIRSK